MTNQLRGCAGDTCLSKLTAIQDYMFQFYSPLGSRSMSWGEMTVTEKKIDIN